MIVWTDILKDEWKTAIFIFNMLVKKHKNKQHNKSTGFSNYLNFYMTTVVKYLGTI